MRDAAYEQMLKETRAELHERFASWVQRQAGERAGEYEEILGYHLEQAHRYLDDLGPLDEHGVELAQLAATRLSKAGRRALARGDMSAAVNLLERAVALVPKSHPAAIRPVAQVRHRARRDRRGRPRGRSAQRAHQRGEARTART